MADSPAEAGGIEDEDIIIRFNGEEISRAGELPHWVGRTPVGEASEVVVFRGGKEVTLSVELGELPENPQTASSGRSGGAGQQSALGVTVRDLTPNRRNELDVDGGAEVVAVEGIAEEAGMRVGDVVLRMKGRVIDDAQTLHDVADAAEPGDVIPVLVLRQQRNAARRSYITLRVPEDD
jgi:serine protease Do